MNQFLFSINQPTHVSPCTVTVIFGGSHAVLAPYPELCAPGVILRLDVPEEIARTIPVSAPANLIPLPLAIGHTGQSLAKHGSAEVADCIRQLPGMAASSGLGQWRAMGALAVDQLLDSPHIQRLLEHTLCDILIRLNNGLLEHVTIVGKAGLSGGTGSAGLIPFIQALSAAVLSRTDATLDVQLHLIGAISYAGLGPRLTTKRCCRRG